MLTKHIAGITLQDIHISSHYVAYLKCIQCYMSIQYIPIKLKKIKFLIYPHFVRLFSHKIPLMLYMEFDILISPCYILNDFSCHQVDLKVGFQ